MDEILYNLRLSTAMKNQVLKDISDIFEYSSKANMQDDLCQSIASCSLALLLLARRCGIDIENVYYYMLDRINTGISDNHICEEKFHDLSTISKFIRSD